MHAHSVPPLIPADDDRFLPKSLPFLLPQSCPELIDFRIKFHYEREPDCDVLVRPRALSDIGSGIRLFVFVSKMSLWLFYVISLQDNNYSLYYFI